MTPEKSQIMLTWLQSNDLDLAEVDAGLDLHLDGALGDLLVGEVDHDSVQAHRLGLILHSESAVLVVHGVAWDVHATLISQGNGNVT